MNEKLKKEILELESDFYDEVFPLVNESDISLYNYAHIVSSSVIDLDNKWRLLSELLNDAELQADEKEQNTVSEIKNACLWLDKVISQFHNPAVGIVTTVRLMGIIHEDLLFRMAGSFPTLNGDTALNAIKAADLDGIANIDNVGTNFWDGDPIYWEVRLYDLSNETDTNKFPAPTYTYLVTLDGVVIDCRDANNRCCFSFDSNFFD